jgi:hypothetical protein
MAASSWYQLRIEIPAKMQAVMINFFPQAGFIVCERKEAAGGKPAARSELTAVRAAQPFEAVRNLGNYFRADELSESAKAALWIDNLFKTEQW